MAASDSIPELPAPATPAAARGPSMLQFLGAMVLLTLIGGGGGAFLGLQLASSVEESVQRKAEAEITPVASRYAGSTLLRELSPIITNLAAPTDTWVRLEASLVMDEGAVEDVDLLAGEITEDILAYLRTVTLAQIEGASGLQHLRDDLDERVAIRSEGRVRELIVQTLVIQ